MTREKLVSALQAKYQAPSMVRLMNALQDGGLVSDCAVTLDDVPSCDLIRAYTHQPARPANEQDSRMARVDETSRLHTMEDAQAVC